MQGITGLNNGSPAMSRAWHFSEKIKHQLALSFIQTGAWVHALRDFQSLRAVELGRLLQTVADSEMLVEDSFAGHERSHRLFL